MEAPRQALPTALSQGGDRGEQAIGVDIEDAVALLFTTRGRRPSKLKVHRPYHPRAIGPRSGRGGRDG
ncbi:hypothetical protein BU197_19070 [Streptomyces sp. CBMA291]|nr:hypothetical protein [Streptomyces sp. CBMA291]MBD0712735.1 hypothetical protein [Streptomyces sp. CBMA370]